MSRGKLAVVGLAAVLGVAGLARGQSDGIFADFQTSMGSFTCRLDHVNAPRTVANFVGLATGARTWLDLNTGVAKTNGFYDGLTFHRVISGFMLQGGSPNALGTDGPGYSFPDEFSTLLRHDGAGVLSMANSGEDTNGSQFFVTLAATTWLNDVHSVFGRVEGGMDVVTAIGAVATDGNDKPVTPVVVSNVTIRRVGAAAAAFNVVTQKLPVVRNVKLGLSGAGANIFLPFARLAYSQYRLYSTSDLLSPVWTYNDLGFEGAIPTADGVEADITGAGRIFFSLAEVRYPPAPANLLNRTLTLVFSFGDTIIVNFNGSGGGAYTYVGFESGAITQYTWTPDMFHGFLSPIVFNNAWALHVRLTPITDTAGTFVDYVYNSGTGSWDKRFTGTFTLSP
ncbi:MAG: peptidylprolyl isomerase [Verrucomicrobia bacterium]|nr:peptidylprolyl isomerase [Verrucomicrobiota bacterium]